MTPNFSLTLLSQGKDLGYRFPLRGQMIGLSPSLDGYLENTHEIVLRIERDAVVDGIAIMSMLHGEWRCILESHVGPYETPHGSKFTIPPGAICINPAAFFGTTAH